MTLKSIMWSEAHQFVQSGVPSCDVRGVRLHLSGVRLKTAGGQQNKRCWPLSVSYPPHGLFRAQDGLYSSQRLFKKSLFWSCSSGVLLCSCVHLQPRHWSLIRPPNTLRPSEWIMSCKRLSESLVLVMLCFDSLYKAGDCPLLTLGNPSYRW